MEKIKVFTDSASDISFENEKNLDIDMINFNITMGDRSYVSRVDFDNEAFYRLMGTYDGIPLTSQATAYEFQELYKKYYDEGYTDVIGILINREGSATYDNSLMAYKLFLEDYPEAEGKFRVHAVDGQNYSGAYGYAAVEAAKMVKAGKNTGEIVAFAKDWVEHCVIYFVPYSLKYAGKSGRIPSAAALVGDKLGIKPVMKISDHKITTALTVRGEKRVVKKITEKTLSEMEEGTPYMIVYGDDPQVKDQMAEAMTEALGYGPTDFYQIGAAVAANAGPRVVGTIFREK
ncbi:DegV family protein [Frisingicoccus sp.]|uniref:DegV family protein n=1 Tax=Frisingicoccus sp. TaxID=1918627 RepID=UPI003AB75530